MPGAVIADCQYHHPAWAIGPDTSAVIVSSSDGLAVPGVEGVEFPTFWAITVATLGAGPGASKASSLACSAVKIVKEEFLLL